MAKVFERPESPEERLLSSEIVEFFAYFYYNKYVFRCRWSGLKYVILLIGEKNDKSINPSFHRYSIYS